MVESWTLCALAVDPVAVGVFLGWAAAMVAVIAWPTGPRNE